MTIAQQSCLSTLSDVMETVLEKVGPDLARRGHRMIVDMVSSTADTGRDLFPVADVIADVLDCASLYSLTQRNLVHVAVEEDHVVMTVRDPVPDSGWPLARRLAEKHGGKISCCSAETERGTEVVVRLQVPAFTESRAQDDVPVRALAARREAHHRKTVARPLLNRRAGDTTRHEQSRGA